MTKPPHRSKKPRSFDLPGDSAPTPSVAEKTTTSRPAPRVLDVSDVELTDDAIDALDQPVEPAPAKQRGISWLAVLLSSLGLLLSLALGLAVDSLVRDLFARHPSLGYIGMALSALVVIATLVIILREIGALMRLQHISHLRERAEEAHDQNSTDKALKVEQEVIQLYASRVDLAGGRTALAAYKDDIIDGRDRVHLIEKELLQSLDKRADTLVMNAAKRVAVVTAVSPRAIIDILYVLTENLRLIRALSELYGGRPGALGFIRLTRNVLSHLALTGILSVGDGLVQQVVGHGLAARLSARFGEGVVNGLLTARIGLAAHDICRPVPFLSGDRPSIAKYMNALVGLGGLGEKA